MFGRKKMYKKGLEDAMRANEAFVKKQQDAIEYMREEVRTGHKKLEDALAAAIHSLDGCVIGLSNRLEAKEKAALYKLSTSLDIQHFAESEKQLLVAVLYQLASDEGLDITEYQRCFVRSVQKYVGISNPQLQADLSVVSDIDSLEVQKAFLRVVLEFLYLRAGEEICDSQEDFLNNFAVNKKQAELIEAQVSQLYDIVGAEGIAEKYGFDPSQFSGAAEAKGPSREVLEREWAILEEVMEKQMQSIHVFQYLAYDDPDYEMSGDGFYSKSDAMNAGERELRKLYNAKLEIFNAYSGSSIAVRTVDYISTQVISVFDIVRKQIREFGKNTTCMKFAQQMEDVLNFDALMEAITKRLKDELQKNSFKYKLEDFSYYRNKIEVNSDDLELETGFLRFFEKMAVKWDYMICEGSMELDDDANRKQKEFASSATEIIDRELRDIFAKIHAIYSGILE